MRATKKDQRVHNASINKHPDTIRNCWKKKSKCIVWFLSSIQMQMQMQWMGYIRIYWSSASVSVTSAHTGRVREEKKLTHTHTHTQMGK